MNLGAAQEAVPAVTGLAQILGEAVRTFGLFMVVLFIVSALAFMFLFIVLPKPSKHLLASLVEERSIQAAKRLTWFECFLCLLLCDHSPSTSKDDCKIAHFDIRKAVDDVFSVYLRRWYVLKSIMGHQVYLHRFYRGDEDRDPHSHPFSFTTIVLWGGYVDESYHITHDGGRSKPQYDRLGLFSVRFRPATWIHQVRLLPTHQGTTWTLVIRGPKVRDWDFVLRDGTRVFWKDYVNANSIPTEVVGALDPIDDMGSRSPL